MSDLFIIRALFIALIAISAFFLTPFGLNSGPAAAVGLVLGLAIVLFEVRVKEISLKRLIGAAAGSVMGIFGAYLISLVLR